MQKAQSLLGQVRALHQSAACPELPGLMEEVGGREKAGTFPGASQRASLHSPSSPSAEGRAVGPPRPGSEKRQSLSL